MGLVEAVAALRAHLVVVRVAEKACLRLQDLCEPIGTEQAAADAGAVEAAVAAMQVNRRSNPGPTDLQVDGGN